MTTTATTTTETCACPAAGFCPVFNRQMSPRTHDICRGAALTPERQAAYRSSWRNPNRKAKREGKSSKPRPPKPPAEIPAKIIEVAAIEAPKRGMLAGDLIAALTTAIGIPPCNGCKKRREWCNRAHLWLLGEEF
jgi:hypothetical protein